MSSRSIPELSELRRQAADLHRAALAGDREILAVFEALSKDVSLASAQLVVARTYDIASWARLEAFVEEAAHEDNAWLYPDARLNPPGDELCAVVAGESFVIGSSARATIAVTAIRVYSTGTRLDIEWTLTRDPRNYLDWHRAATDHTRPFGPVLSSADRSNPCLVRYGVEFADGRAATNVDEEAAEPGTLRAAVRVSIHKGGGQGGISDSGSGGGSTSLYICPLPPPGELRLIIEWPVFEIVETVTALDSNEILAAAERVQPFS